MPFIKTILPSSRGALTGKLLSALTVPILVCVLTLSLSLPARAAEVESSDGASGKPVDPEQAIKQFKVPEGFKSELFAAEPQLKNPVSFCFDEQGRIFVAETFRYKTASSTSATT